MRSLAVFSVVIVHSIHITMYACDVYNDDLRKEIPDLVEQIEKARGIMKSYLVFGIPMFFYVSGASATFYNE